MSRWRGFVGVVSALALLLPVLVHADAPPPIFITEVQTANTSASQEFIELYNNTDQAIDLAQDQNVWKIQYFSSTKVAQTDFDWNTTPPSGTIDLTGTIAAHNYYLLTSTSGGEAYKPHNVDPDQTYAGSHLADAGGGLQLIEEENTTVSPRDHVGWFTPTDSKPMPPGFYMTPPSGGSLQRTVTSNGSYVDDQGNLEPFTSSTNITPKAPWSATAEEPPPSGPAAPPLAPQLTELLPNPAAPATDTNDEFVELYNPNDQPVDLSGYTVQTGLTYAYSYSFTDTIIMAHGYVVLTSGTTNLSLANSGGQARLMNPGGQVVSTTEAYSDAPEGEAWALINSQWQWTPTPTPGGANILTLSADSPKASTTAKKTTDKAKAATTKKTASKFPTGKTAKSKTLGEASGQVSSQDPPPTPLHPGVLAGVGGAAVLYGAYEYRSDVANKLYQLRRYRGARRAARAKS